MLEHEKLRKLIPPSICDAHDIFDEPSAEKSAEWIRRYISPITPEIWSTVYLPRKYTVWTGLHMYALSPSAVSFSRHILQYRMSSEYINR